MSVQSGLFFNFEIKVLHSNINAAPAAADEAFNFDKTDTLNQRTSYAYDSVMHYDRSV